MPSVYFRNTLLPNICDIICCDTCSYTWMNWRSVSYLSLNEVVNSLGIGVVHLGKILVRQIVIGRNLWLRNQMTPNFFNNMVACGALDGADISLMIMSRMLGTVIAVIGSPIIWISHTTFKWTDIGIAIGMNYDGSYYSTGIYINLTLYSLNSYYNSLLTGIIM